MDGDVRDDAVKPNGGFLGWRFVRFMLFSSLLIVGGCHDKERRSSDFQKNLEKLSTNEASDRQVKAEHGDASMQFQLAES